MDIYKFKCLGVESWKRSCEYLGLVHLAEKGVSGIILIYWVHEGKIIKRGNGPHTQSLELPHILSCNCTLKAILKWSSPSGFGATPRPVVFVKSVACAAVIGVPRIGTWDEPAVLREHE